MRSRNNRAQAGAEQPNRERRKAGAPRGGTPRISPRISPHHARRQSTSPAPARRSTTRFDSHTLPATALLRNGKREMKPNKGHSRNHEPRARSATEAASGAAHKRANTGSAHRVKLPGAHAAIWLLSLSRRYHRSRRSTSSRSSGAPSSRPSGSPRRPQRMRVLDCSTRICCRLWRPH